jgi:hypothetical protein
MASPPIFDSGGNIPGGLPVMSDQEVHLLAGLLDPDFLTKQVEAHSRIFDSPHHITISDSEPPQALDNRFTLGVKYSSATSLATPSLFSTQSTDGVPAYIHDIKQVLGTMMYDQGRILNAVLDSERMQSRHRIMTIDRFNREFPVGRGLLYDIIVLTKSLVFQDEECLWGGKDLSDTSFHRIQRHASNAIAIITYDHSLGSDAPDDGMDLLYYGVRR